VYGVSFVLVAVNAALVELWFSRTRGAHARRAAMGGTGARGAGASPWTCPGRADTSDVGVSPRGGSPNGEEGGGERGTPAATPVVHAGVQSGVIAWCGRASGRCQRFAGSST